MPSPPTPQRRARRRWPLLAAVVLLLAVAGVAVVVLRSGGEQGFPEPAGPRVAVPEARATYYVDAEEGADGNRGDAPGRAWKTAGRAAGAALQPGDRLLFRRGRTWRGTLSLARSGAAGRPIVVAAYGDGDRPRFTQGQGPAPSVNGRDYRGSGSGACVLLRGSYLHVRDLEVSACRPARAGVKSEGDHNVVERLAVSRNEAGIVIGEAADDNRVVSNVLRDNDLMTVNTCGGDDDYGAYNIALEGGTGTEVAYNRAEGAIADSCDYGADGSMVEIVKSPNASVHHNVSIGNDTFAEVGGEGAVGNSFSYNRVFSAAPGSVGFIIHGGGQFAGARRTSLDHNTVRLTGAKTLGIGCNQACGPGILRARDNVLAATEPVVTAAPFDEDYNLFSTRVGFRLGPHSIVADPEFAEATGVDLAPGSPAAGAAGASTGATAGDARSDLGAVPVKAG